MLFRKLVAIVLLLCVVASCHKKVTVPKEQIATIEEKIVEAVLVSGDVVKFDHNGAALAADKSAIQGTTNQGKVVTIRMEDLVSIRVSKINKPVMAVGIIGGAVLGTILIAALAKESCPFVYSFDGQKYVFDAEPLGGAVTQGLQKTDYSMLEHLQAVDGKYRLLVRNEVKETQYTDSISLLVVDHPPDASVVPDVAGNLYLIRKPLSAIAAYDENHRSLLKFVSERDDVAWQTKLPKDINWTDQNVRHQLTFEFPKPANAKKAKLLVNAGTALWGSHMIRTMLELRGNQVDSWYQGVNHHGPEVFELMNFVEREELYVLKVHVRQGDAWKERAVILGQGPFINEDRAIDLDVSDIPGEKLTIRLNPPMGFWAIDYLGVSYEDMAPVQATELSLESADQPDGKDVSALMQQRDGTYQTLPEIGDSVKVSFSAPPEKEGSARSVFLKTSGYYEIHLSKDQPEQKELIQTFMNTPDAITRYAIQQYLKSGDQVAYAQ